MVLSGIRNPHDENESITEPASMNEMLRDEWQKTFSTRYEVPVNQARAFLAKYAVPFPTAEILLPSVGLYKSICFLATPSAPGPDGVPLRCW